MDGGWTLDIVGVRGVDEPVVDDGGGRVVSLNGLARGHRPARLSGFSQCQGPYQKGWTCARCLIKRAGLLPGALPKGLDFVVARILDQRTGLARCHPRNSPPPPPHPQPLTLPLYIVTAGQVAPGRLYDW